MTATERGTASREPAVLIGLTLVGLLVSGWQPYDRFTWLLEVAPVLIALPVLIATARRFRWTPLAYRLMFVHGLILMLGGAYTYARVPLGFWLQDLLGFARNPYDRIGHLAQGFVPAILARELLIRTSPLGLYRPFRVNPEGRRWLVFLVCCVCLGISVGYEFIEWWTALLTGTGADAFLGTQGDVWDTQWDMFMALCGALLAQLLVARRHERELAAL
jgi:putative membrane protein